MGIYQSCSVGQLNTISAIIIPRSGNAVEVDKHGRFFRDEALRPDLLGVCEGNPESEVAPGRNCGWPSRFQAVGGKSCEQGTRNSEQRPRGREQSCQLCGPVWCSLTPRASRAMASSRVGCRCCLPLVWLSTLPFTRDSLDMFPVDCETGRLVP
jgi:hypothetical protein